MISVATPHLAEDWWKVMGNDDLIAGRTLTNPENLTTEEKSALEAETYLRSFLEQARKGFQGCREAHWWPAEWCSCSHF